MAETTKENTSNNSGSAGDQPASAILNFNVGVLGHVDSGKTSLVKVLSTESSTACFDKNPQSQERGITLDLGFSSFQVDMPDGLKSSGGLTEKLQYTLVDCPGHASLIRTIIGGAQIIDLMLLVVDVTKGIQTQTAECLIIGEITCDKMIIVLNKVDLIDEAKRAATVDRMSKKLQKTLEATKFSGSPIVPVAASPGGSEGNETAMIGITELIDVLKQNSYRPTRDSKGPFMFAVDHCFSIRGQGTVMTGTVISGGVAVNDNVEIPSMKITKKIKSMQMFKKPTQAAKQGDRVGICVTQFDPKLLERGLVCTPGALSTVSAAIAKVSKVSYFKGAVSTKAKFHITMGHETVMGKGVFFSLSHRAGGSEINGLEFDYNTEYKYQDELMLNSSSISKKSEEKNDKVPPSDDDKEKSVEVLEQFVLLEFETPIVCARNFLVIGSKLDTDIHSNTCRIAFHGRVLEPLVDKNYAETFLPRVKVFKNKEREGLVERKADEYSLICRGLFKKESDMKAFIGLKVRLSTGEQGFIEGGFGQSGKFKVRIPNGLGAEAAMQLVVKGGGKKNKAKGSTSEPEGGAGSDPPPSSIKVLLQFKRYIYDTQKRMIQT